MKINTTALEKLPDGVDADAMVVTMVHYGPDVCNRVYIIIREHSPSPDYPDYYSTVTRYGKLNDYRKYGLNALRGHGRGGSVNQFYRIVREKMSLGYHVVWTTPNVDKSMTPHKITCTFCDRTVYRSTPPKKWVRVGKHWCCNWCADAYPELVDYTLPISHQ